MCSVRDPKRTLDYSDARGSRQGILPPINVLSRVYTYDAPVLRKKKCRGVNPL